MLEPSSPVQFNQQPPAGSRIGLKRHTLSGNGLHSTPPPSDFLGPCFGFFQKATNNPRESPDVRTIVENNGDLSHKKLV